MEPHPRYTSQRTLGHRVHEPLHLTRVEVLHTSTKQKYHRHNYEAEEVVALLALILHAGINTAKKLKKDLSQLTIDDNR